MTARALVWRGAHTAQIPCAPPQPSVAVGGEVDRDVIATVVRGAKAAAHEVAEAIAIEILLGKIANRASGQPQAVPPLAAPGARQEPVPVSPQEPAVPAPRLPQDSTPGFVTPAEPSDILTPAPVVAAPAAAAPLPDAGQSPVSQTDPLPDDIVWQSAEHSSYPATLPDWAKTMLDKALRAAAAMKWPAPLAPYVRRLPPYFQTRPAVALGIVIGAILVLMIGGMTIVSCGRVNRRLPAPIRWQMPAQPRFHFGGPRLNVSAALADSLPSVSLLRFSDVCTG